ncbi:unnamed protein product [Ceutorhynchus assimilis]|uniref:Sex-determining region Y protein n=1 Tax=Ceutorhynchus assimilis TaxID=467358 RepID=A0A9N9QK80_9CUCU|nr:unnamed protein product [Ceutorhynchus assimilis]
MDDHFNLQIIQQMYPKVPRPPNAFMLYANENRKVLSRLYPTESNAEISKRLGQTWKMLCQQKKNKYFMNAKLIDKEHKRKHPGYVYNPKDARVRKALRANLKDMANNNNNNNSRINELLFQNDDDLSVNDDVSKEASQLMLPSNIFEMTQADKELFENEKQATLQLANAYETLSKSAVFNYRSISSSASKIIDDPQLYSNNTMYHEEYIVKYFNNALDYDAYNVTTEDGFSFPYIALRYNLFRHNNT